MKVGRCSVPTHAATLISGGGRDVAKVAGTRTGASLAVLLVLATLSVSAELMARRRGRVARMGTLATVSKFLALQLDLANIVWYVKVGEVTLFFDVDASAVVTI